jgi:hypothetical protein
MHPGDEMIISFSLLHSERCSIIVRMFYSFAKLCTQLFDTINSGLFFVVMVRIYKVGMISNFFAEKHTERVVKNNKIGSGFAELRRIVLKLIDLWW